MAGLVRNIVIVGGGAAGWLTAGVLAAGRDPHPSLAPRVTLVESPDVPTLGVGEGTWPSMRDTLRHMGVDEKTFIRACDVSFKQGTRFTGWRDGGGEGYDHPFTAPRGWGDLDLAPWWRAYRLEVPYADIVSPQPAVAAAGLGPKQARTPDFAAVANYAYHLDAGRFGEFLREHCTRRLGVAHVVGHVDEVIAADNGDIAAVTVREHGRLGADLFVDCTGFGARLLGRHYGVPFVSVRQWMLNDAALVVQAPYPAPDAPVATRTLSSARDAGWIWDIGLPTRRGLGYVHSTSHCDAAGAERVLADYLRNECGVDPDQVGAPRLLAFEPGYRETCWHRNCVAVGVSAGFIEPLEASALALVELAAAAIRDHLPMTRGDMGVVAARFNERCRYRWERVVEFLKLHYVLSRRDDSVYWRDQRLAETCPDGLADRLSQWRHRAPSRHDFDRIEEVFPSASYAYVLNGMGFEPAWAGEPTDQRYNDAARLEVDLAARQREQWLAGLPAHRELLDFTTRE